MVHCTRLPNSRVTSLFLVIGLQDYWHASNRAEGADMEVQATSDKTRELAACRDNNQKQLDNRLRTRLIAFLAPSGAIRFDLLLFVSGFVAYLWASDFQLNDYDAVNYALAVREFNVALDMPHPPGAPVFVAFVKLLNLLVNDVAVALCIASALGGALFVVVWRRIFILFLSDRAAAVGAIVLAISPGMWMTASQPMSDSVAAALLSACVLMVLYYARGARPTVFFVFTALLALSVGVRPQFGILAIVMLFVSMLYCRLPLKTVQLSLLTFTLVNLAWLLPTVYSQFNLDGTGWLTYFNQILRFQSGFGAASGSPLLADHLDLGSILFRAGTHVGALGYFGLGLNLWYPESVGLSLQKLGTELNPWYADTAEWTVAGSLYMLLYVACAMVFFSRLRYYKSRCVNVRSYLGYLLFFAVAYFLIVMMLVPPHIRFYLPLMPFFILLALLGIQSKVWGNRLQYLLLFVAVFSALPTLSEAVRTESPPVALIHQIQEQSNPTGKNTVLFLNTNASRHALWYLPDARIYRGEDGNNPENLDSLFADGLRVFSNSETVYVSDSVKRVEVAKYRRSYKVWMRHTSTALYELKYQPRSLALDVDATEDLPPLTAAF